MDQLLIPLGILAGVGAVLSHIMSNMRVRRAQRDFIARHTRSVSQLADAAVEVMAVEYGADIEDAMNKLMKAAQDRNPSFVGLVPKDLSGARAHVEKLRKEKASASQTSG